MESKYILPFKQADETSFVGDKKINAYILDEMGHTKRLGDVSKRWQVIKEEIRYGNVDNKK